MGGLWPGIIAYYRRWFHARTSFLSRISLLSVHFRRRMRIWASLSDRIWNRISILILDFNFHQIDWWCLPHHLWPGIITYWWWLKARSAFLPNPAGCSFRGAVEYLCQVCSKLTFLPSIGECRDKKILFKSSIRPWISTCRKLYVNPFAILCDVPKIY